MEREFKEKTKAKRSINQKRVNGKAEEHILDVRAKMDDVMKSSITAFVLEGEQMHKMPPKVLREKSKLSRDEEDRMRENLKSARACLACDRFSHIRTLSRHGSQTEDQSPEKVTVKVVIPTMDC
ncbi:predicted protein [Nematostella vectensis]|uniref:Uncharacterized protein n=1 Tax=Nematostella vectensis TaxID=45351 RepID=A7RPG2_NEMVE|nr:predicted protein [Nematostella vectensis]|eukprot:XP_001638745.1 predicted protein [Nematostella vectensis]